jgi:hypothetical protein
MVIKFRIENILPFSGVSSLTLLGGLKDTT